LFHKFSKAEENKIFQSYKDIGPVLLGRIVSNTVLAECRPIGDKKQILLSDYPVVIWIHLLNEPIVA